MSPLEINGMLVAKGNCCLIFQHTLILVPCPALLLPSPYCGRVHNQLFPALSIARTQQMLGGIVLKILKPQCFTSASIICVTTFCFFLLSSSPLPLCAPKPLQIEAVILRFVFNARPRDLGVMKDMFQQPGRSLVVLASRTFGHNYTSHARRGDLYRCSRLHR